MASAIKNVRNFVADTHAGGMLAKRVWTRSAQQPLDVDIYTFEPGGAQDTHYHPDSAELAICWSGRGRATIALPQGTVDTAWKANPAWQPLCLEIELAPGDTLVVPQGALHRLEATLFSDADKPKLPADKRATARPEKLLLVIVHPEDITAKPGTLPGERHVTVYMTDADIIDSRRNDLTGFLQQQLRSAPHTRARCGDLATDTRVMPFAAMTYSYPQVHGRNWLLAGDAAMAWDPLSGQGICKALESGMHAARAIDRALNGDDSGLNDYAQWTHAQFDAYLQSRAKYYRAEQRWPDAPFWRRRHLANEPFSLREKGWDEGNQSVAGPAHMLQSV